MATSSLSMRVFSCSVVIGFFLAGFIDVDVVVSHAHAKIAKDDVVRLHFDAVVTQHDSGDGSILAINRDERFLDVQC